MPEHERLFIKIRHEDLPQVKDRYPFLYLERGRIEVDDSSIKWIDSSGYVMKIPVAIITSIVLGPGTSITHEAIKVMAAANCTLCWAGEDSLLFYSVSQSPTSSTRNLKKQIDLATNPKSRLQVAKKMFLHRFPHDDIADCTLQELMGMEGKRVKKLYESKAEKYGVGWRGRSYVPDKIELSDMTNKVLTVANAALYSLVLSSVYSLGFSPHVGFVHTGSPLPFIYDIADLYKEELCIDLAFCLTRELAGEYNKYKVADKFRTRVIETGLLENIASDIKGLFD